MYYINYNVFLYHIDGRFTVTRISDRHCLYNHSQVINVSLTEVFSQLISVIIRYGDRGYPSLPTLKAKQYIFNYQKNKYLIYSLCFKILGQRTVVHYTYLVHRLIVIYIVLHIDRRNDFYPVIFVLL